MDTPSKMRGSISRSKSSPEYWRKQVLAYQDSELSMTQFCKLHHLKLYQFRYWLYRLRKLDRTGPTQDETAAKSFIPVEVVEPNPATELPGIEHRALYFRWEDGKLVLEFGGLPSSKIAELMAVLGGWYAQP